MRRIGIVNRGEPAVRFLATLAGMAFEPEGAPEAVALYTDSDADALFVRRADHAVRIGADRTAYLDARIVVAALLESGCDAAWLGWGFASEDGDFAAALEAAGITLLAPRPETMTLLGDKIRAKLLAEQTDVPVAPWAIVDSPEAAEAAVERVGLPLLVKAAGGGGGRGIRRVDRAEDVAAAFVAARDEAARSFRSDGVMLERLIGPARHVEVQVLGDGEGGVITLGLRDCSLQRRRQKVIEEAQAPQMPEASARRLMGAAQRLCGAAKYRSAGTVEFLYDAQADRAYFLEVNTRLQVEHPVTEAVFGLDLVRAQIELARGKPLPDLPEPRGWAVEARLCAEDPHHGFAPAPGRIVRFVPPSGPGLRLDAGFAEGDTISPEFDPLVAKLIAWAPDRSTALARLAKGLEQTRLVIEGGTTNLAWLRGLLDDPAFRAGAPDIGLVDRLIPEAPPGAWVAAAAAAIDRFLAAGDVSEGTDRHRVEAGEAVVVYRTGPDRFRLVTEGGTLDLHRRVLSEAEVELTVGAQRLRVERAPGDDTYVVEGVSHRVAAATGGALTAPSASLVLAVPVAVGQRVEAGACVAVVESMKMEVRVQAPQPGRVREIRVAEGAQVAAGQVLVVVEPEGEVAAVASPLASAPWGCTDTGPAADRLVAGLVGWDRDPAQTAVDQGALDGAGAARVLAAFADVAELFERRPSRRGGQDGAADAVSAGLWIETLRQRGADALAPERRAAAARALAHHGVEDDLSVGRELLEDPLRRLVRAGQGLQRQIPVALAALRALTADDGAVPLDVLDRLADLDPARFGPVAEAADRVRYERVERPAFATLCREGEVKASVLLDRLRSGQADWGALVTAPEALLSGIAPPAVEGCPVAAEAVARRLECQGADEPVQPVVFGGVTGFRVGSPGAERLVLTVAPGAAAPVIRAVAAEAAPLTRLTVVVAGQGEPAALLAGCVEALGLGVADGPAVPWDVLCLAAVGEGLPAARSYRGWGPEIAAWRDLLPATAQALQLERLADFEVDRRPAPPEVVLLRAKARSNPDDVRLMAHGEIRSLARAKGEALHMPHVERVLHAAVRAIQAERATLDPRRRMHWNRITLHVLPVVPVPAETLQGYIARLAPAAARVGLEKVVVRARFRRPDGGVGPMTDLSISRPGGQLTLRSNPASDRPFAPHTEYETRVVAARRRGLAHPHEWVALLEEGGPGIPPGRFTEHDLVGGALAPVDRAPGENTAALVVGVLASQGLPPRVMLLSDATRAMGALAEAECARVVAALDLAEQMGAPVEWVAVSAGAKIDMATGTENLDWTARVLRRIVTFTQAGGAIDVIVPGVCVGAQAYWNAEATMMMHTRGLLIMTDRGSMVLTGKRALDFSGCVSAEDDLALGGYTTIMGPNGQAQAYAPDLPAAFRLMARYRALTAVAPGQRRPPRIGTADPEHRDITHAPYPADLGHGFERVGDLFSAAHNPDRKRPFAVRPVMEALMDADVRPVERWAGLRDAETAVVWETRVGGYATTLIGIENRPVTRLGALTEQGPDTLAGGTLYPQAARKIARALNAASGKRPAVVLANLSGFDGSPESLARWQLEYGAEIGRAVVNFDGPIVFVVLSRYHGGAYVVFSKALNPELKAVALEGSYASVIGGAPAAAVVFGREVRKRAQAAGGTVEAHTRATAEVAAEFDAVHSVERARQVGSIDDIVAPARLRPYVIDVLRADHAKG
ncbi:MAG: biotin/lipoyl-binding protein [Myxococcales bacterium]|nr:biotin/lipoyl-binding protein [Myxococcales bacterium]